MIYKHRGSPPDVWDAEDPVWSAWHGRTGDLLAAMSPGQGRCSVWRLHRHGGVPTRRPINFAGLQAPWGPNRRVGCLISSLKRVAWTYDRYSPVTSPIPRLLERREYVSDHKNSRRCRHQDLNTDMKTLCQGEAYSSIILTKFAIPKIVHFLNPPGQPPV